MIRFRELRPRTKRWLMAFILAAASLLLALATAGGNLSPVLVPTAILTSILLLGSPEATGMVALWVAVFFILTLALWTVLWSFILWLVGAGLFGGKPTPTEQSD